MKKEMKKPKRIQIKIFNPNKNSVPVLLDKYRLNLILSGILFNKLKLNAMERQIQFSTGFWNDKKPKLKKQFPMLSDSDLVYQPGNLRELMNCLSNKLGKSGTELRNFIIDL